MRKAVFAVWLAACVFVPGAVAPLSDQLPRPSPPSKPPERVSRLQGTAYFDRNQNVVGATVLVQPESDAAVLFLTSTNEQGKFKIGGLPDGEYRISVDRHGVEQIVKENVNVRFPFRAVVELRMAEVAREKMRPEGLAVDGVAAGDTVDIRGTVEDQDEAPLAEVQFRLVRVDAPADPMAATSGEDGIFEITGIAAGDWALTVKGVGKLPVRTLLYLRRGGRLHVTLVRQPPSYEPSPLELMPPEEPIPPPALDQFARDS